MGIVALAFLSLFVALPLFLLYWPVCARIVTRYYPDCFFGGE